MKRIGRVLISAAILLAACGSQGTPQPAGSAAPAASSPSPLPGGSVTIVINGEWPDFDIQAPNDTIRTTIAYAYSDRLVAIGPKGETDIVPYLAKSWKATATSATFDLRTDATCADGAKLTPTAIASSMKRLFNPATKSSTIARLFGPGPYTVQADDAAGTLTITLGTPWADFVNGFAHPSTGIICPAGVSDPKTLATQPSGSGPYTIESAVRGDSMKLKLRPEWSWGPNGTTAKTVGLPQQLTFRVLSNATTAANAILTGEGDLGFITGPDITRLENTPALKHVVTNFLSTFVLFLNHMPGRATADDSVREAIMAATDQSEWNKVSNDGRGTISPSFLPPKGDCWDADSAKLIPTGGPTDARAILQKAGWTVNSAGKLVKDGKPLEIRIASYPATGRGPEYLASNLEKMGATVTLDITDINVFTPKLRNGEYDIAANTQAAVTGSPGFLITSFYGALPPAGTNYGRTPPRASIDSELKLAQTTTGTERCTHWKNIQQDLIKGHDYMPLASPEIHWFSRGLDFVPISQYIEIYSIRRVGK